VAFSICWFLYKLFESYQLKTIGQLFIAASLYGLFLMPLYQVGKFFYVPGRIDQVKKPRFYASLGILSVVLLAILFLPLPHSVICTLEIQARDAQSVTVEAAGKLVSISVKPGETVAAGQELALLKNDDIDIQLAELEGNKTAAEAKLRSLMEQGLRDPHAVAQVAQVRESILALPEQWEKKVRARTRLRLTAPVAGGVLPPALLTRRGNDEEQLPTWAGTPLDPENLGAYLEQGVKFCEIGDPKRLEAVVIVDQADRNIIRVGQKVDLKLEGHSSTTLRGLQIKEIAERELTVAPQRLTTRAGGELPSKVDPETGRDIPISTSYQARVPFDDPNGLFHVGLRGQARSHTDWLSIGARVWRLLTHTFNFKL